MTEEEIKRLERYFRVKIVEREHGGLVIDTGKAVCPTIPQHYTYSFAVVRKNLCAIVDRNQLARDIVALLFWRWRATLHTLTVYAQQARKETDIPILATGHEAQAYNDFMAARNAYYGDWK